MSRFPSDPAAPGSASAGPGVSPCGNAVSHYHGCPCHEAVWAAKLAAAEAQCAELEKDYGNACLLVAKMHLAATGYVTGPRVGPVEDVAEMKARADRYEAALETIRNRTAGFAPESWEAALHWVADRALAGGGEK